MSAFSIKKLGPGFLFAGAAIGVSHLVQSTRAGADFGFGLLWALVLINVVKYPFFQYGTRYATATGNTLLDGYKSLGKGVLIIYFVLSFATMFTIQTAVTIVTAGIATSIFGSGSIVIWTAIITGICSTILLIGKYKALDNIMKIIVISLTISTIIAVILATGTEQAITFKQIIPQDAISIGFLIAFMGWMPAPLDISIWQSMWTVEKQKTGIGGEYTLNTVGGKKLTFFKKGVDIFVKSIDGLEAEIGKSDITATNGMIHVIDNILYP